MTHNKTPMGFWMWLLKKLIGSAKNVWPSINNWWRTPENQNSSILALAATNLFGTFIATAREGYHMLLWLIPTAFLFLYYTYRAEPTKPNERNINDSA